MLPPVARRESPAYFAASSCVFIAGGINGVLYPWLVTVALKESAEAVGIAQMMSMLPMFLFLLHAGALADKVELRRHIITLCLATLAPLVFLGVVTAAGRLDFWLLVVFGFAINVVGAFMMTARETALVQIAHHENAQLPRMILLSTAVQFGSQIGGNILGGLASNTGALPLIAAQAVLVALAALLFLRIEKQPPRPASASPARSRLGWTAIYEGLDVAFRNRRVWPFLVQNFLGGILFMGVWMVGMPLMLRDFYGAGSQSFAIVSIAFMVGVTLGTLSLSRRPEIARPGRFVLLSLIGSWLSLVGFAIGVPLWGVYALMLWWGLCAGVSMATGRAVVQAAAAPHLRGRLISVYMLAQMGGAPLGAFLFGVLVAAFGLKTALLIPVFGVVAMWLGIRFLTPMWTLGRTSQQEPALQA